MDELKKLIEERKKLLKEINNEDISEERVSEIEKRVKEIQEEEDELRKEAEGSEKRKKIAKMLKVQNGEARSLGSFGNEEVVDLTTLPNDELRRTEEYRTAFLKDLQGKKLTETEERVLTTADGSAEAAVPTETLNMVIDKLRQTSILFDDISVSYIGGNVTFTVADAKNDASWKAEGTDGSEADDTVSEVTLTGYELIKLVSISAAARNMTISAFEQYIVQEIGRKMSIAIENAILNGSGSGSNEPTGIFTGVTFNADNSVQYTDLTYDDVVDMTVKLPTMYHQNAQMVMSRKMALGDIRKIKDTNGNPIFVPSTVAGQPPTLLGYPVKIDDYMPNDTDILFGDFSYYKMNFPLAIEIASSSEAGFASGKIIYRGLAVADGKPALDEAFVKLYK